MQQKMRAIVEKFRLPRYDEIPDVGLYLEQVTKYISGYCTPLFGESLTSAMISNYVKKGLINNPVKKQYGRDQIAYLLFITAAKSVLTLNQLLCMVEMQKKTYANAVAYNYFCNELENMIQFVFGLKDISERVGTDDSDEKVMLRNTIVAVAHRVYLDQYFKLLKEGKVEN
ncbi:MAG: DUF1836 domain-containing protein [Clostridia bacterium]|nr:DUF1836 domain-containing protein [Clostridia bacterium]